MNTVTAPDAPRFSLEGAVARIELARPQRRNALRPGDLRWMMQCFETLQEDPGVRVLVLAADTGGADRPVYCAGYDLDGFEDPQHDPRLFEQFVDALESLALVTVCALSGSVYGGATDMMLACDLRVAVSGARVHMPAAQIGLHYYPSGLRRYVSCLGVNLAKRAFLGGRSLSVEELQVAGVFDAVVSAHALDAAVDELVTRVAALGPLAVRTTKQSLQEISQGEYSVERLRQREAMTLVSEDFAEGRRAVAQGRPPVFSGR